MHRMRSPASLWAGGTVLRRAARATHANVEAVAIRCYVNLWAAIGQIERR
jgi:hypothetical protein